MADFQAPADSGSQAFISSRFQARSRASVMLYAVDLGGNLDQYELSADWDISSASLLRTVDVKSDFDVAPFGVDIRPNGSRIFMSDSTEDEERVVGLDLSATGNISTATLAGQFGRSGSDKTGSSLRLKTDGTKMYLTHAPTSGERYIEEFDLSTAWDVTSASFVAELDVSDDVGSLGMMHFKPDGTKMYINGGVNAVGEYDLSTAWDITSASFSQTFVSSTFTGTGAGISFKPDGEKMFLVSGNDIGEFDLSTPWDISTASFTQKITIAAQTRAFTDFVIVELE